MISIRPARAVLLAALCAFTPASRTAAHPLGNFSVNRWCAIEPEARAIRISYAVDFAEIPTFQESSAIDRNGDGSFSEEEVGSFASHRAEQLGANLDLVLAGARVPLHRLEQGLRFFPGAGGLRTMKLTALYEAGYPAAIPQAGIEVSLTDTNFEGRAGWREMIAYGDGDEACAIVRSSVPAADRSNELSSYPSDLVLAPPQISTASFRLLASAAAARAKAQGIAAVKRTSGAGAGSQAAGRPGPPDGFARLIEAPSEFGLGVLIAAFAGAVFWGAAHALSPGHGKTVVAAYLVGQRGTPLHAVWLGLIVTITHTMGVFALGVLTLVLSQWFVPESLYPWLGFVSGLTVAAMGTALLYRRLRQLSIRYPWMITHGHDASGHTHRPGPGGHSHEPPNRLSIRGLLALGISGGIVPCPTALVVLLSAIAFHRILFGMALILAFSTGLAGVLVAVGLLMLTARQLFDRFDSKGSLAGRLSVVSAAAILLLGIGIAVKSIPPQISGAAAALSLTPAGVALGVLGLGLLFGLKHATEADHIAAVSAIVSEQPGMRRALWTGGLWGAGHTLSILIAGLFVLGLHLVIPEALARLLEFGVALMIIGLGGAALARVLRDRPDAHVHRHSHGLREHAHLHFHDAAHSGASAGTAEAGDPHETHTIGKIGLKPLAVGMMHGLAGSAALTLLVLAQIRSAALGLLYLLIFGVGSIGGMVLMSLAIGLPFAATAASPGLNRWIRLAASALSLAFGLFYAWAQLAKGGSA